MYLAFVHYYTKIHRMAPAEVDLQRCVPVTPPVVHQMVETLAARGFIDRAWNRALVQAATDLSAVGDLESRRW